MAKLILTISADNKATQSVKLLNTEIKALSQTLSSIKVDRNLTAQINALTKHYTALAKAAVRVNEATTKRQIAEQRLANEVKRGRTEEQRTLKVKAQREQAELRLKHAQDKAAQSTQNQTNATEQNTDANKENEKSILSMAVAYAKSQIAARLVLIPLQLIRSAISSINDTLVKTEDTVIAVQRVVRGVSGSQISNSLYDLAIKYGQTFENVQSIALDFARTGLSWNDTLKATEAALFGVNTAELSAEDAAAGLIAVMKQFGKDASELESIIDKLNITQDNAAVTTDKLLAALQRTGSAASNANLSLEETVALITALSASTGRSGQNLGTALNSLIQYSRKESALEVFSNLSDEARNVVDSYRKGLKKANGETYSILDIWRQVSKEIQSLDSRQADLLDSYFSTEDGSALSEALDGELEDIYTEMAGVYDTANTFRKNYFIALLGNMDEVEKALGNMDNSVGYSQKQNDDYMQSYTARLNSLQAKWQELANDEQGFLDFKKGLVDIGSILLTLSKLTGGLRTALIAAATALSAMFAPQILAGLGRIKDFFKNLSNPIKNLEKARQAAIEAQKAQTLATNLQEQADIAAATANQLKNTTSASGAAIEAAETAAIRAQTVATQAQARADQLAAAAATARAIAMQGVIAMIGIAITLGSILIGIFQSIEDSNKQASEERQRQNQEIIAEWEAIKKEAVAFAELNKQYNDLKNISNKTTEQENEFLSVQQQIVETLGYKAIALKKLTEGTAEYQEKLEELSKDEVDSYAKQSAAAAIGAHESYYDALFNSKKFAFGYVFTVAKASAEITGKDISLDNIVDGLDALLTYIYDSGQRESSDYYELYDYYKEVKKAYESYLTAQAQSTAWEYIRNDGIPQTQSEIDSLVDSIIEATGASERWRDTIEGVVVELTGFKTPQEETDNWANDITKVKNAYDDLIKKLEELRDLNKEAYDWEEKKLAVLEAEQALENARNEATVRRFNQATNQWEWQTDEKAIKEAEENLEKARLNLEEAAYNNIIDQLKEQTATNESILAIIEEVAPLLGEDFGNAVQNAIKDKTNVDITQPAKSYDSGGIANGLGFMPKATAQPETVNDPELTAKILSPVSNAQFDKYVRDMGIMFEMARQYSQVPVIERVGGATDNRIDNSGQTIMNGVVIGSDRRGNTLDELLMLANIVPKN
ncbi:MAG: phage tail tape measure protein [Eubacterium sp.]|nr:phage tail tape measure protein [Eubacterium sp.]